MEYIWAVYYASIVSMQHHPGAGRREHVALTLAECARVADLMLKEHQERYPCHGESQQAPR